MIRKIISILLVIAVLSSFFFYAVIKLDHRWQWHVLADYRFKFLQGFVVTLLISAFSLIGSLFLGILAALGRRSKVHFFHYLASAYIEVIRGTPLLVQILVFFYIIGTAYGLNNRYVMGVLIMSIFAGAYMAEIIRGGLESIPSAQLETARSLCFTPAQTYRHIIIPQLSRIVLPPLTGQFASLVKDSSLLSVIAVNEFAKNVTEADSLNFATFENYFLLAVGYMLITLPISWLTKRLERKMYYAN
ncbi:MAG TPA: amino acid ABC transporter permease [Clostridiales bacterium]|nr:amino acid ABC transporter permease [Clostridiales bacterium]